MAYMLKFSSLSRGTFSNLFQGIPPPVFIVDSECNAPTKRCFGGGDMKIVANRMKSIKSTQKITKAMKMVAASKLKSDQRRLDIGIFYGKTMQRLIHRINIPTNAKNDLAILAISSDQGLCGGVNSSVAKETTKLMLENEANSNTVTIFGIGDKIRSALNRLYGNRFSRVLNETNKYAWNFSIACLVAERIIQEDPARFAIIYNHFKSAISYDTNVLNILTGKQAEQMEMSELDNFEFDPERTELWKDIHEFYVACSIHSCVLDNITSEQSARMSAMDNASSNAADILSNLTLKYNRARQAKITLELIEIISGASAL